MQAKDIMTTKVITVPQDGTVEDAVRLMLEQHVSALPVVGADARLVGLISEGDLMRRLRDKDKQRKSWWLEFLTLPEESAQDFVAVHSHKVADVMTRDVVSVTEDTPVSEIADILQTRRIKRVPVVRDGKVVGIVSRSNLLRVLARSQSSGVVAAPKPADSELQAQVAKALDAVPGVKSHLFSFVVEDGKVSVWGVADSDIVEKAVRVALEEVPGVREVDIKMGRLPSWGYGI